ncbi:hypothetical protein DAI22_01g166750 [Oryza sativa Japonica Group]|nr:hypothetical protein DAI22_01g166750 [Oryza sativa Japonica Group]
MIFLLHSSSKPPSSFRQLSTLLVSLSPDRPDSVALSSWPPDLRRRGEWQGPGGWWDPVRIEGAAGSGREADDGFGREVRGGVVVRGERLFAARSSAAIGESK